MSPPFTWVIFECGTAPSNDGEITILPRLQRIEQVSRMTYDGSVNPVGCPDFLTYHSAVELGTDDGSISGTFEATVYSDPSGLSIAQSADPSAFVGTLGIRVDTGRPQTGGVGITVELREEGPTGQLFTLVDCTDGNEPLQSQGNGVFWPPHDIEYHPCGWLDTPPSWQAPMMSLDEYNRL